MDLCNAPYLLLCSQSRIKFFLIICRMNRDTYICQHFRRIPMRHRDATIECRARVRIMKCILCSETFDRAWTIRVSLYRPQTALSERGTGSRTWVGSRSIGKSNMRRVNTANSLDQHIRGLIWRSGRYVTSRVVCPATLTTPVWPRIRPGGSRNCFEFCCRRVNRNCIDQSNSRSNWVVSINKTEFSPSVRFKNATVYRGKSSIRASDSRTAKRWPMRTQVKSIEEIISQLDFRSNEVPLLSTERQYDPKIN